MFPRLSTRYTTAFRLSFALTVLRCKSVWSDHICMQDGATDIQETVCEQLHEELSEASHVNKVHHYGYGRTC